MRQLMDVLSLVEVPKPVPPHVDKACSRRETAPGQIGARGGQQCLASVADGHQPRAAIQRLTVVMATAQLGLARVDGHPDPQMGALGPGLDREGSLNR